MDISDLTYNGLLVLHTYNVSNPDLDSIVISEVKFIAKHNQLQSLETETNPQTGDIGLQVSPEYSFLLFYLRKKDKII